MDLEEGGNAQISPKRSPPIVLALLILGVVLFHSDSTLVVLRSQLGIAAAPSAITGETKVDPKTVDEDVSQKDAKTKTKAGKCGSEDIKNECKRGKQACDQKKRTCNSNVGKITGLKDANGNDCTINRSTGDGCKGLSTRGQVQA